MSHALPTRTTPPEGAIVGEHRPLPASSVVELIVAHARSCPDAVALEFNGEEISYRRLLDNSTAIVAMLHELRVGRGDRVALWADRTPAIVAAALATMRIGAAYVPIDPTYPPQRVEAIVGQTSPVALLHDGGSAISPPTSVGGLVDISTMPATAGAPELAAPAAGDAAYVVFTSGSSGVPKGVVVEHRSLLNYVTWCADVAGTDGRGTPLFASLAFDHSMTCLWVPLAQGKRIVVVPGLWDQQALFGASAEPYSFLKITPSHVRFFERMLTPDYSRCTRLVMFGGEALDPELVLSLGDRLRDVRLLNHYGPTEATVGCCWHEFDSSELGSAPTVPIGKPIWNSRAYVVDPDLHPVDRGEEGELVMAGACVARGYLDSGAEAGFLDESLICGDRDGPAYRTGDLVRQLPDGALVYLGRNDSQIKVGGLRFELAELRKSALTVAGVAEVAFDVCRDDVDRIEAFVVPVDPGINRDELSEALRRQLASTVPAAVVPSEVLVVGELVFNAHGKVDIAATRRLRKGRAGR